MHPLIFSVFQTLWFDSGEPYPARASPLSSFSIIQFYCWIHWFAQQRLIEPPPSGRPQVRRSSQLEWLSLGENSRINVGDNTMKLCQHKAGHCSLWELKRGWDWWHSSVSLVSFYFSSLNTSNMHVSLSWLKIWWVCWKQTEKQSYNLK